MKPRNKLWPRSIFLSMDVRRTVLLMTLSVVVGGVGCSDRDGQRQPDMTSVGASVRPSTPLLGRDLASSLGLVEHSIPAGATIDSREDGVYVGEALVADCVTTKDAPFMALKMTGDSTFYCPTAASKLMVWVLGERLLGHDPTGEEIAEIREALE